VSGADPIDMRPGFAAMLERIEGNGVACKLANDGHDIRTPTLSRAQKHSANRAVYRAKPRQI